MVVYEKHFMRTFIHVSDMANAFMLAVNNVDKMVNNVYNIGDDSMNHSKEEVCRMVADKTGAFIHFEEIEKMPIKEIILLATTRLRPLVSKHKLL